MSQTCDGSFTLSPDCRTSDDPELLIWGDSYAMHLVQGILASSHDPKIIQMTKSDCGPFFSIAPVSVNYPVSWANDCLGFTEEVHKWIKSNHSVKYVVLASHFNNYLVENKKLLHRNGKLKKTSLSDVLNEFKDTLDELKSLGVIPIIFSSPPANGIDLGRCLAKASWMQLNLEKCNFNQSHMTEDRKREYKFLDMIKDKYPVIRLDKLICNNSLCNTHYDDIWLFRDKAHLSKFGSAELGTRYDFYKIIANSLVQ